MSKFLHEDIHAKAIAIPQVFSKNSKAKNKGLFGKGLDGNHTKNSTNKFYIHTVCTETYSIHSGEELARCS